jgi:hypothetical protein
MTKPIGMTYHESYGTLPTNLLRMYRRYNVSPADHDRILMAFGWSWDSTNIVWQSVLDFVLAHTDNGQFNLPMYL